MTNFDGASEQFPSRTGRLDSWKEIARYLNRDESTVQRWEKREGMPVHRHVHAKRGSVYAFAAELDAWWESRRQLLDLHRSPQLQGTGPPPTEDAPARVRSSRRPWIIAAALAAVATSALVTWRWVPRPETAGTRVNPSLVRLTSTSGVNIDPALSPDASMLAYSSDRGGSGNLDIWVQPTGSETPTRVTQDAGDEIEPAFSPDGASIVFAKAETGGIYIVGAVGGDPRLVAPAIRAHSPRFSPDGKWVAYWTGLPSWAVSGTATGEVMLVPAAGGESRPLSPAFSHARNPVWSPDGDKLLVLGHLDIGEDESSLDWYVVDRAGRQPARTGATEVLRRAGIAGLPIPAAWTDRGVIFATYADGSSNVWQLGVSPTTGHVTGDPVRLTFGTAIERSPSVSASGRVVFASLLENVDVWRIPLDRTGRAAGDIERVTDNAAADRVAHLSADGRTLAFLSARTGQDQAWIRDLPSGRERQVTFARPLIARMSPDGSTIAVSRSDAERSGVELIPVGGGPATALCDDCDNPDWFPDGQRLLIRRERTRLFVRQRASGREMPIASHPSWALNTGRVSPDGRWAVFHSANTPSLRQVYAVPTFTNEPVPVEEWVPIAADFGMQPSWSRAGDGVYYFSLRDGAFCAWLQRVDQTSKRPIGAPVVVKHFHEPRLRGVAGAGVTNDVAPGYLYVTLSETAANIWMLEP